MAAEERGITIVLALAVPLVALQEGRADLLLWGGLVWLVMVGALIDYRS